MSNGQVFFMNLINIHKKKKTIIPGIKLTIIRFGNFSLRTTMPFVTAHLEIFYYTYHPVIPKSDLYFTFCSSLNALSKRTSK